jgi:hypothetical protein
MELGIIASFSSNDPDEEALANAGLTSIHLYRISTFTSFDGGR